MPCNIAQSISYTAEIYLLINVSEQTTFFQDSE